jgi:hypothetical protein
MLYQRPDAVTSRKREEGAFSCGERKPEALRWGRWGRGNSIPTLAPSVPKNARLLRYTGGIFWALQNREGNMPIDNVDDLRVYAKPVKVMCKRMGLTKNERKVLKVLADNGADECMVPITQKRIALEAGLQQSKVCYALERLKMKDYILVVSIGRADAIGVIRGLDPKSGRNLKPTA